MATGRSNNYDLPFPLSGDAVNVHGDIKTLAERLDAVLPQSSYVDIPVKNSTSQTIPAGYPVYITGHDGTHVTVGKTLADTGNPILGLVRSDIDASGVGVAVVAGVISGINTSSYSAGDVLFVSEQGGLTNEFSNTTGAAIATVVSPGVSGIIIVGSRGNATWGSLRAGLS